MDIAYVQHSPIFGDKEKNFEQVRSLLRDIKADLLVLPELFATSYAFTSAQEAHDLAESTSGPTATFLKEISAQTGAAIVAGFVERDGDAIYNSSLIISNGEVLDTYRKIHLFNKETLWFSPGNKPLNVYDIQGVKVGVMICFDWIFPEVCRTLALQGMQILAHPSNLVMPYCQAAMVTRCLENRVFAVTANRVGTEQRGEDRFTFTGASQITGTDGSILASAPVDATRVDLVDVDPTQANNKKVNPFNDVLADRRTEFYAK